MKFDEMTVEELEARQAEIAGMSTEEVATEELEERANELEAIKAELEARKQKAAEEAEETRNAVAQGAGETKEEFKEETKMDIREIRSSAEYCEAYKKYIITGDDKECRSLLSANASTPGDVPVPTIIEDKINDMDIAMFEELVMSVMKNELNAIVNLGFFIGLIIGVINIFI